MRERKIRNDFGLKDGVVRKYSGSSETAEIPYGAAMIAANAFRDLEQLTAVTIPDSMRGIGPFAFYGCKNLASIRLPDSVTTIYEGAFRETAFFNNPENWTDDVLYIGHHLIRALPSVSGAYTIRAGTRTIAEGAFACCKKLTAVTVPDSVLTLGIRSFENCTALQSVSLPDTLKIIGGMAFQGCTSLTQITLPLTLSTVEWNAFAFCEALTQVDLPAALTCVELKAFRHCINLKTVHYGGSQAQRKAINFFECNHALTDAEWIYAD